MGFACANPGLGICNQTLHWPGKSWLTKDKDLVNLAAKVTVQAGNVIDHQLFGVASAGSWLCK
jgi:hypothetical protein